MKGLGSLGSPESLGQSFRELPHSIPETSVLTAVQQEGKR